jgi:hypothetical protein
MAFEAKRDGSMPQKWRKLEEIVASAGDRVFVPSGG